MISLFTEPLNQLTPEHVETLFAENVPEGQTVEFKQTLAANKGRIDPWLEGGESIGKHARNDVLKEIVAFANSGGGNLVLGIVESKDHPSRAAGINALPRCHDLVERFRLMARDCIDPQLPSLEVWGVPCGGGDENAGIVLFRVPPSRLAPHRLEPTLKCYLRRADRTEGMTMREIQDTSVRLARGGQDVERRLEESREHYMSLATEGRRSGSKLITSEVGVRATVLPVGGNIFIDRVYRNEELQAVRGIIDAVVDGARFQIYVPAWNVMPQLAFRPVLRGARRVDSGADWFISESIYSDGLVEFAYTIRDRDEPIYVGWGAIVKCW